MPIYYFYGEEDFLLDEALDKFKQKIADRALNLENLDGAALTLTRLTDSLLTSPLLGGDKLVIVKDFELDTKEQDGLIACLRTVPPELTVVFTAAALDRRSKLFKFLDEHGEVVEFKTFAPWELDGLLNWIKGRAQKQGKSISSEAARLLQEIAGSDLRLLAGEIDKLVTFIGGREAIAESDVLALAAAGEASAFALTDALRAKDLKRSLALFQALLKNKEEVFPLLALLASQYRTMLQVKSLAGRETDFNRIARLIGGSPYYVKKCSADLGRFTLAELRSALPRLLEAGNQLKTGANQAVVLELLMAELCGN
jgi:DNA polymerase III subunit delta